MTPPYKEGAPATLLAVSPDGSHAIVQSVGNYGDAEAAPSNEGSTYELTRTEAAWREAGINLPQSLFAYDRFVGGSEDLSQTLWLGRASSQPAEAVDFYVRDASGDLRDLGPTVNPAHSKGGLPGLGGPPGFPIVYSQASRSDLSHVLWAIDSEEAEVEATKPALWPGDTTAPGHLPSLYEYTAGDSEPRLVGVENEGRPNGSPHVNEGAKLVSECGTNLGSRVGNGGDDEAAVSNSGSTVFFTARAATEGTGGEHCNSSNEGTGPPVNELDARVSGEKTLKISSPAHPLAQGSGTGEEECDATCEAAAPQEGVFQGASREGSSVFFLTKQPLLNGDEGATGTGQDLYEAEIEGEGTAARLARLVQVSRDPNAGQAAEVQGVTRISEGGSHVYFVAKGELAANSNGQAAPFATAHDGAENLYVYEPDPASPGHYRTVFIAMLCSEEGMSGSVSDSECHSSDEQMWNVEGNAPAQATPDGRFLVFSTATDLTAPEDTSTVGQVFRYDAETGELVRVSIGQRVAGECVATKRVEERFNCNGNTSTFAVFIGSPTPGRPVAISDDGSYVAFQSADGLTPRALNGQEESIQVPGEQRAYFANNVYEYHDGEVSLISDGRDTSATLAGSGLSSVRVEGMTPSGADVFFTTADQLVPQDTDTQQDIYDARIDGGFPPPPVPTPCQEEACQGPPGAAPLFGAPASSTFSGAGNLAPPAPTPVVKPKPTAKPLTRAQQLAKALRACKSKPRKKRAACVRQARKRYGSSAKAKQTSNGMRSAGR
jgi:hypothetical protein